MLTDFFDPTMRMLFRFDAWVAVFFVALPTVGEIAIRGHLPVTISSAAERGFGMQRPARSPE